MKIIKFLPVLAGLALSAPNLSAQQANSQSQQSNNPMQKNLEAMAEHQSIRMQQTLGLSSEQYKSVYTINLDFGNGMRDLQPMDTAKKRALVNEKDAKMKSVLTDEQYQKYLTQQKRPTMRQERSPAATPSNQ